MAKGDQEDKKHCLRNQKHTIKYTIQMFRFPTPSAQTRNRLLMIGIMALLFTGTAAAQATNPLCEKESENNLAQFEPLVDRLIQGAFFLSVAATIMTHYGTIAIEALPIREKKREKLNHYRSRSFWASLKISVGGPAAYFLFGNFVDLSCIDLIPFVA
jgi:hypothetical protein